MLIVRTGHWRYDDAVDEPVDIVGLDHDFWFAVAEADGDLSHGEAPVMPGESGLLFYVRFRHAGEQTTRTWPDSAAYRTIEEAVAAAQERAPTPIAWDDAR